MLKSVDDFKLMCVGLLFCEYLSLQFLKIPCMCMEWRYIHQGGTTKHGIRSSPMALPFMGLGSDEPTSVCFLLGELGGMRSEHIAQSLVGPSPYSNPNRYYY